MLSCYRLNCNFLTSPVANEIVLKLALSETQKAGFLGTRPIGVVTGVKMAVQILSIS